MGRRAILWVLAFCGSCALAAPHSLGPYFWPTPNAAFLRGGQPADILQPTASGRLASALFGCVRNQGRRFHEGIDLKPISRDARSESTDPIYAFDAGVIRYVNRTAGNSSYGRYVVVEHPGIAPGFVTLYAHLRNLPERIQEGLSVAGGEEIGIMGRSAGGYAIPRSRAHLHFEIGLWLGGDFQKWFDQQPFDSGNEHGAYNGMNIVGADPWDMCRSVRDGVTSDAWQYLMSEQVALEAYVRDTALPELLCVNPSLMDGDVIPADHAGWKIDLSWYGMPTRFYALTKAEMGERQNWLEVEVLRPDLLKGNRCLDMANDSPYGGAGPKTASLMRRLFVK